MIIYLYLPLFCVSVERNCEWASLWRKWSYSLDHASSILSPAHTYTLELQTKVREYFTITEKAPTRAFSWLKTATTPFTFKTLLRHYAKWSLTPQSLNVKLGPWRNYHKGRAAIRHYANQTARPLWPMRRGPNFTLRDRGVNAQLA